MEIISHKNLQWLYDDELQLLLHCLSCGDDGDGARVVGGAVRNSLLNKPIGDIDIATQILPNEVVKLVTKANFKAIPTGLEHGTITVVGKKQSYEVTTLRQDIETTGRHATVLFTKDWATDAKRRDFTINALYLNSKGEIFDYVDGLEDLKSNNLRFIGNAKERITEDYLRILRFFRFYAYYGDGRPDHDAILACTALRDNITSLASERIWSEFSKLLASPSPTRSLLWMRQTKILDIILPESKNWGLDHFHFLMKFEAENKEISYYLLRLISIIPPRVDTINSLAKRLKLSKAEKSYLKDIQHYYDMTIEGLNNEKQKLLYNGIKPSLLDFIKLRKAIISNSTTSTSKENELKGINQLADYFSSQLAPEFPINSQDLFDAGIKAGKEFGTALNSLKELWFKSDFKLKRSELLNHLNSFKPS